MKRKEIAKKLAVMVLSAAMIVPMAPVSAFAAQNVSVEAAYGDTATSPIGADNVTVTVKEGYGGKTSTAAALKTAIGASTADVSTVWNDTAKAYQKDKSAADFTALFTFSDSLAGYAVNTNTVQITDTKHYTFEVENAGKTEVYTATVAKEDVKLDEAVTTALDNYFNVHTFEVAKDGYLTNSQVAAQLQEQANDSTKTSGTADAAKEWPAALSGKNLTFSGDTTKLDTTGDTATGTLTVNVPASTIGGTTYSAAKSFKVTYTANIKVLDQTADELNAATLAKVNATAFPSYNVDDKITGYTDATKGTAVRHNLTAVENAITKAFTDAKATKTPDWNDADIFDYDAATATKDGFLKANVKGVGVLNVKLTYNSDSKSSDTNKSVEKALKGTKKEASTDIYTTADPVASGADSSKDTLATTLTAKDWKVDVPPASKLSTSIQAMSATQEVKEADVVAGVQKAITSQLTSDKVADNGVKVEVKAVNKYNNTAVEDGHTAVTTKDGGKWTLLVKTSIANDFYKYNDGSNADGNKTTDTYYLVTLHTNALKEQKATAISLADTTVNLTNNYATTKASDATKENPQTGKYTYVEIKPTLTPADSNDTVTYKVVDKDGKLVKNSIKAGTIVYADTTDTPALYKLGSSTELKASAGTLGLAVTKAGKYTVTATTASGQEATATVTINSNFKDVSATAYYADAVQWAYANGITSGVSADKFGVNQAVTRGQFITWLYKEAVNKDASVAIKDEDVKTTFSDVATTAYYAKAVQWAVENGITAGTSKTTFSPNAKITRAQAVTMLWTMVGKPLAGQGTEVEQTLKFTDVPSTAYYKSAVLWAVKAGVTSGTSATTFGPKDTATRAQAVTFVAGTFEEK